MNGGLGLELAGIKHMVSGIEIGKVNRSYVIAYAVVAGVVGLIYMGGFVSMALRGEGGRRRAQADKAEQAERLRYELETYRD